MSPRKRSPKNKGLEPNLYIDSKGYFLYRHPQTGSSHGMGRDKAKAQEAARILNSRLTASAGLVDKVLSGDSKGKLLGPLIDDFIEQKVETHPTNSERTKKEKAYRLRRIQRDNKDTPLLAITTQWCADYLDQNFTKDAYRQHRISMKQLFDYAQTKGLMNSNPVLPTEKRDLTYTKSRRRLKLEEFKAIRELAEPWFRIAMDMALLCCQGRYEVANMRFDKIQDARLLVIREKTKKTEASHVSIAITPAVEKVITEARALPPLSPYIVHRTPLRHKDRAEAINHWAQVTPEMLTRTFKKHRDSLEVFKAMPPNQRPSFHEIRALGGHLIEQLENRSPEEIQALMGHADIETTGIYLEGHKEKYISATAGNYTI